MERKGWYLVAYDISDPRRLSRIHRFIKKHCIAAQKSVFFVQQSEAGMNHLLDKIAKLMSLKEDDLRAYPILHPKKVWSFGPNPMAEFPLMQFDSEGKKATPRTQKKQSRWKRMFGLGA